MKSTINPYDLSEDKVKETLEDMKQVYNSMQQQLYKLKERISIWQQVLLKKQEERITAANAHKIDTRELEAKTGLSRQEILKAMTILKHERK